MFIAVSHNGGVAERSNAAVLKVLALVEGRHQQLTDLRTHCGHDGLGSASSLSAPAGSGIKQRLQTRDKGVKALRSYPTGVLALDVVHSA